MPSNFAKKHYSTIFGNVRAFLTGRIFQEIFGRPGSKRFLGNICPVYDLNISDRLLRSKSFFKIIFLVLYAAAFFVVRGEGMGWGRMTGMEE